MAAGREWTTIFDGVKESIFFIIVAPKENMMDEVQSLVDDMKIIRLEKARKARALESRTSTGFVVRNRDNRLWILTCAHGIDHVYKASQQISTETANDLFEVTVLCDHYESDYRAAGLSEDAMDTREYVRGTIIAMNCMHDLLLIEVEEKDIKRWLSKEEKESKSCLSEESCERNHLAMETSQNLPREGEDSMLLSWPSHKHRLVATGHLGVRRRVQEISRPNLVGYEMIVLEANITSEAGSSGAPLLSMSGQVIGLLHGGFEGTHSYFIPSDLILLFLASVDTGSGQGVKDALKEGKGKEKEHSPVEKWGGGSAKQQKRRRR